MGKLKVILLGLVLIGAGVARAEGDLTPGMVQESRKQLWTQYRLAVPYLSEVMESVPFRRDSGDRLLHQFGSSMGIYMLSGPLRGNLILNKTVLGSRGLDFEPSSLAVVFHEGWHAYLDQLMPPAERRSLEEYWVNYYGSDKSTSRDTAICYGDEAMGSYVEGLAGKYASLVERYKRDGKLAAKLVQAYRRDYEGFELYGYCAEVEPSPRPISAHEMNIIRRVTANVFPKPEELVERLKLRFPGVHRSS